MTLIAPSSAPMPAPIRPESSRPAVSGPVSLTSAIARPAGIIDSAPKRSSDARVCIDSTTPTAMPDTAMRATESDPELVELADGFTDFIGRTECVADTARRKQGKLSTPGGRLRDPIADGLEHSLRPDLKGQNSDFADTRSALGQRRRARDLIRGAHDARQRHDASVDVNDNVAQPEIGVSEQGLTGPRR